MYLNHRIHCLPVLALAGATVITASAAPAPAHGEIHPYELKAHALQDVRHVTDIYLLVHATDPNFGAPTASKHVQLKSFDTAGELRWTKNSQDVSLLPTSDGPYTFGTFTYSDMSRYQPVNAQVQVQNDQTVDTKVLKADAVVQLRPDLTVHSITAPPQVRRGQVVNIEALVRELNGDLGAVADVSLSDGASQIDIASGVAVAAHGSASALFATVFDTLGEHTLTVTIASVNPGDYDASNNTRSFTIQVVDSTQALDYWGLYSRSENWLYTNSWNTPYGDGTGSQQGRLEGLALELWGLSLTIPVDKVSVDLGADGQAMSHFEATTLSGYGWYVLDPNYGLNLYLQPDSVSFFKNAGDYIYHSIGHDYYWGSFEYQGHTVYGTFLNATSSIDARVVIDDDGQSYGGSLSIPVRYQPFNASWDFYNPDGSHYWGSEQGDLYYGYAWGTTVP